MRGRCILRGWRTLGSREAYRYLAGARKKMIQVVRPVAGFELCRDGRQLSGVSVVWAIASSV